MQKFFLHIEHLLSLDELFIEDNSYDNFSKKD